MLNRNSSAEFAVQDPRKNQDQPTSFEDESDNLSREQELVFSQQTSEAAHLRLKDSPLIKGHIQPHQPKALGKELKENSRPMEQLELEPSQEMTKGERPL